ncbi:UpxY family transcription antiterminator [Pedobacter sp. SYP-B3415]|uniref:UpxY family transcription antiterminator n=1 Tax=Pedobacter sp. SYP-B3415 TaxID=2496641 RepID=UPI00101D85BF|nr:UpxY family transcription antiterminator [Pedobacter sp. SYP-B3415]
MTNSLPPASSAAAKNWYVVYTWPRWEKKVTRSFEMHGITTYCPLRKVKNQWADRVKEVELPLFPSYVFIHISMKEELKVRSTLGVVNFVYHVGKPAKVSEEVIEQVRHYLRKFPEAEVVSYQVFGAGDRVRVKSGLMTDKEGEVIRIQGKHVLVVIDSLSCALVSKLPASSLALV